MCPMVRSPLLLISTVNQTFPSGPAVRCQGRPLGNSVTTPEAVIRPIRLAPSPNQRFPSAPCAYLNLMRVIERPKAKSHGVEQKRALGLCARTLGHVARGEVPFVGR